MKRISSIMYFLIFVLPIAKAGNNEDLNKLYTKAEDYFNSEKYAQALPLYLTIESMNYETANINFKIGICYLFTPDQKSKAISYLLTASKNVSENAKENSLKEKKAPLTVYYYLAQAYHVNYQFDKAIANYEKFKTLIVDDKEMTRNVNRQIATCKNGKEFVSNPIKIGIKNLGPEINSKYADYSPVISADESTIIFTSRREGSTGAKTDENGNLFEDIYIAQKTDSVRWGNAVNIGPPINTDGHEATIGLSVDGQKLFIYKDDKGDGNIYFSELTGKNWSAPVKMNENINTPAWEPSASFSADGDYLYFTSNREGGWGGRDIYRSKKLPNGQWAKAQNLGPDVNTSYDEDAPFIHPDGKTLYFSSTGHKGMGGFDIFYTVFSDSGSWSTPENMGYPINTTEDDIFFVTTPDNKRAYYSSTKAGGYGEKDIYMLSMPEKKEKSLTVYRGEIKNELDQVPEDVEITVTDNQTGEIVGQYYPNTSTGIFLFILTPGKNYNITYQAEGYLFHSENMDVPLESSYSIINKAIELNALTVGSKVVLKNIFFDYNASTLRPTSNVELDKLFKLLNKYPKLIVEVSGFTDSKGDDNYNLKLSQDRSESVVNYLVQKGISKERMVAKGYGKASPVATNDTEEGKQLNRRVEYKILSTTGEVNVVEKIKVPENLVPKNK
jgi:outer membrane protein OmpA-like peptidoglycan-associated protein/Tol biopolymer transport system component